MNKEFFINESKKWEYTFPEINGDLEYRIKKSSIKCREFCKQYAHDIMPLTIITINGIKLHIVEWQYTPDDCLYILLDKDKKCYWYATSSQIG